MTNYASIDGQRLVTSALMGPMSSWDPRDPAMAAISPWDRGVTLGDGVFETIKVTYGTPWYLEQHLLRLTSAAAYVGIPMPTAVRDWIDGALHAPDVGTAPALVLRVTLTRGVVSTLDLTGGSDVLPTTIITMTAVPSVGAHIYNDGLSAQIASAPRNERALTANIKTTSYAESILALRAARSAGYDDVLFLDTRGAVSEASSSNVFVWMDDTLVTPPLECGILPGITRAVVIDLAKREGMVVHERVFLHDALVRAQEVFCTSSIRGIAPVVRIGDHTIATGAPGARTRQLMAIYAAQTMRV